MGLYTMTYGVNQQGSDTVTSRITLFVGMSAARSEHKLTRHLFGSREV